MIAAATMIACQPQKWIFESMSDAHARLQEALRRVVDAREDHVADEREDDRVGVQRAEPAEREVRQPKLARGNASWSATNSADQHADHAPHDGRGDECWTMASS